MDCWVFLYAAGIPQTWGGRYGQKQLSELQQGVPRKKEPDVQELQLPPAGKRN